MLIPIADVNVSKGHKPLLTVLFIFINIGIFLYQWFLPPVQQEFFVYTYGNIPSDLFHGYNLFTLITSMFLHGGWLHLLGNMLFLWIFADNIEATIGSFRFLGFYLGGGIVACFTHAYFSPNSIVPCIGASGAIAACLGAYMMMFPGSKIKVLLFFLISFRVPAFLFLGIWIAMQLVSGMGTLGAVHMPGEQIAYWAHIGGFVYGFIFGMFFRSYIKE
ncbi:MAG: rhomboid family intramembrane serine protease [Chitinophagaceae bacterium]|nr:rhomboid family intramembrane serine protease [Chitinophagaceae bacterium]